MKYIYLAIRSDDFCDDVIGAFSTFDKAKAELHRIMSSYSYKFVDYIWDKEYWCYRPIKNSAQARFHICKKEIDKSRFK